MLSHIIYILIYNFKNLARLSTFCKLPHSGGQSTGIQKVVSCVNLIEEYHYNHLIVSIMCCNNEKGNPSINKIDAERGRIFAHPMTKYL